MKKLLLVVTLALCAPIAFAQNVPSYVPADGLVGYWGFNGNANDQSGNGNNGTVNGATLTTDRYGNIGKAYNFNGSSNIQVPNSNSLQIGNQMTVSVWFTYSNLNNGVNYLLQKGSGYGCTNTGYHLGFDNNQGADPFNKVFAYGQNDNCAGIGDNSFLDSSWHNITIVYNPPNGNQIYFDGILQTGNTSGCNNCTILNTNDILTFGAPTNSLGFQLCYNWNGTIDDIGIWNRALTQQEITTMYNSVEVPTYSDTCNNVSGSLTQGLVGYWPFCGNANDDSGNVNNGTVNGATLTTDRFGNTNSAYHFNGNQENIKIQNSILPSTPTSFTISMWIKYNGGTGSPRDVICDRSTSNYSYKYRLIEGQVNNNQIYGWYSCSTVTCSTVNPNNLSSNWENIIGVVDVLSNNMRLYRNGILIGTSTNGYQYPTELNPTYIGANVGPNGALDPSFLGEIDDIGIWNRALSQQEITQLYNQSQCMTNITVTDTLIINVGQLSYTNPIYYANNITLYPNPANTQVNISFTNITDLTGGQIHIINSLGQQVATTPITLSGTNTTMPLTTWGGAGLYFVQILNSQGQIVDIKKIILQ